MYINKRQNTTEDIIYLWFPSIKIGTEIIYYIIKYFKFKNKKKNFEKISNTQFCREFEYVVIIEIKSIYLSLTKLTKGYT